MPRPRYPHAHREHSRYGKPLWYFRRGKGKRIRLPDDYGGEAFKEAYEAALIGEPVHKKEAGGAGTLRWLWKRYQDSAAWSSDLSNATRRQRENIMKHVLETAGDKPLSAITRKAVVAGRDRRKDTPAMVRHFVETMRGALRWAVDAEHVKEDPTRDVKVSKPRPKDITWTDDECDQPEAKWPLGTRERLTFDIML